MRSSENGVKGLAVLPVKQCVINQPGIRRTVRTYVNTSLSAFTVVNRVFGVLLRDALLPLVETFARFISPPFLEFAVLVVQATGRVESVL